MNRDLIYEAVFRKADELRWEGEEQFMGELVEIVDAALDALLDGAEVREAEMDEEGFLVPVESDGTYNVVRIDGEETE